MGDHAVVGSDATGRRCASRDAAPRSSGVDPLALQRVSGLGRLGDRRRVGDEDPARPQHALGVRHDLPRLGQVEHDPVERPVVDAVVAVAELDAVARQRVVAEERPHVVAGRGWRSPRASRSRRSRRPSAASSSTARRSRRRSRTPASPARCRPACRSAPGPSDRSPARRGASPARSPRASGAARCTRHPSSSARPPLGLADDVGVGHEAGVAVELAALGEHDEVAPALGVEQQHALAHAANGSVTAADRNR